MSEENEIGAEWPQQVSVVFDSDAAAWIVGEPTSGPAGAAKLTLPGDADLWVDRADASRSPWLRVYVYEAGGVPDPLALPPVEALYGSDLVSAIQSGEGGRVAVPPECGAVHALVKRIALALDLWDGGDRGFTAPAVLRGELAAYAAESDPRLGLHWLVDSHLRPGIHALTDYDEHDAELLGPAQRTALLELCELALRHASDDDASHLREVVDVLGHANTPGSGGRPVLGVVASHESADEPASVAEGEVIGTEREGAGAVRVTVRIPSGSSPGERELWVRAVGATGELVSLGPVVAHSGGGSAAALLPLPDSFDIDRLRFDVTPEPITRSEPAAGVRAAVALGARAAGAQRRGRREEALDLWASCAREWAAAGDDTRAALAERQPAPGEGHAPLLAERVVASVPAAKSQVQEDPRFARPRVRREVPGLALAAAESETSVIAGRVVDVTLYFVVDRGAGTAAEDSARLEAELGRSRVVNLAQSSGPPLRLRTSGEPIPRDGFTSVEVPGARPLAEELEELLQWFDE